MPILIELADGEFSICHPLALNCAASREPRLPFRAVLQQRTDDAVRVALRARGAAVVREIEERAAERVDRRRQLARQRILDRPRLLAELRVRFAVAEAARHPADARVRRQHRMIGGEQQHPVRPGLAELRQRLQRPPRGQQRAADDRRQLRRAPEDVDAGAQRLQPVVGVGARQLDALLELLLRRAPHRVGGQRADALERGQRRIALARRRMRRQHFPDEQRERIARRRAAARRRTPARRSTRSSSLDTVNHSISAGLGDVWPDGGLTNNREYLDREIQNSVR